MRKPAKGKGPTTLAQKSVSKDMGGSSSRPLRIKRVNKPLVLKTCAIFEEDEEPLPPQGPTIASLNNKIINLREDVRILKSQVADNEIKIRDLGYKNNVFRFGFGRRLLKVARAAGVEGALD
jgi:hypothetical protein